MRYLKNINDYLHENLLTFSKANNIKSVYGIDIYIWKEKFEGKIFDVNNEPTEIGSVWIDGFYIHELLYEILEV